MSIAMYRALTGCVSALALTATACADNSDEELNEALNADASTEGNGVETVSSEGEQEAPAAVEAQPGQDIIDQAPASDWRTVSDDRLLVIDTTKGTIWVEMAPEFAPNHVARMTELSAEDYYDYKVWHRVIDGFMSQAGGAINNPNAAPDKPPLEAEFTTQRGTELTISELQNRTINPRAYPAEAPAGFWNGIPAGTQPIAQAAIRADGQVESWLLHCPGAAAMARTNDPNSARGQFYITRDDAPHLNADYTVWGFTRVGLDVVRSIKVGSMSEDPYFEPDTIRDISIASALPEEDRLTIEVMDTQSDSFSAYLDAIRTANEGELPDICEITVPVRVTE